jgi:hypothetical protein
MPNTWVDGRLVKGWWLDGDVQIARLDGGIVFKKTAPHYVASYGTLQYQKNLSRNEGGIGEGWYRVVGLWYPQYPGTVRVSGWVQPGQPVMVSTPAGSGGGGSSGTWEREDWGGCSKIFRIGVYVDETLVADTIVFSGGLVRNETGWYDSTVSFTAGQSVSVRVYLWGAYGSDHVNAGVVNMQAEFVA